jgi:hypothetical protein
VEVLGTANHSSLLRYGNNYCRKKFYNTGPSLIATMQPNSESRV